MSGRSVENFIEWLDAFNPTRAYLLGLFKLDKELVRGSEHFLWDRDGTQYLDFLSQFGAVSLGHSHPELARCSRPSCATRCRLWCNPSLLSLQSAGQGARTDRSG